MLPDESNQNLYWTTQGLITDLVALIVDLEYVDRIRVQPGATEQEKPRIRRESENAVLDRHKVELKAELERLEKLGFMMCCQMRDSFNRI